MTPQERDVIGGIFDRLKQAANQPREPEAERFIADKIREQPYAPYAMAQTIYVQEQALVNLQAQLDETQNRLRELEERKPEPAPQSGGFLSGIFGGGSSGRGSVPSVPSRSEAPASGQPSSAWTHQSAMAPQQAQPGMAPAGQPASPWGGAPGQAAAPQPGRGGGFMATALTTAAGVAGGMMLGNVLTNAFGSQSGASETSGAAPAQAADTSQTAQDNSASAQPASDNTNYDDGSSNAANYQEAGYEEPVDDGFAGFDDGGDDWA